jgi:DNA-binding response OmpR family regulator
MTVLAIENNVFRNYLVKNFVSENRDHIVIEPHKLFLDLEKIRNSVVLLQAEGDEEAGLQVAKRLKRFLGIDVKIIFFGGDERSRDDALNVCESFLKAPSPMAVVTETVDALVAAVRKVLLIDDSKLVHSQLVPAIVEEGYEVHEAFNGKEGVDKAAEVIPDLVICDIEMPVMNGYDACRQIRANKDTQNTYIIMSSTLGAASDMQKGFQAGVDEYITKPVVIPELLGAIERVFKQTLSGREDVLVLSQNETLRNTVSKGLKNQGFLIKQIHSVEAFWKEVKKMSCELAVIDSDLPETSVMSFVLQLKNLNQERKPAVLLLLDRDDTGDARMALSMGVAGVISKPFNMDNLLAVTERVLATRRSEQEREQMLRYMSKSSVKMAEEKASVGGGGGDGVRAVPRQASVFFSDIVSFTARCERYTAADVVDQINTLFSVMTRIIQKHNGDIDKFIGDACKAFWMSDDPVESNRNMVRAALEIRQELVKMNEQHQALRTDPIEIRIGMNAGEVILCDIGSPESRIDLTIIGDNVNLASRIEAASKQYGVETLISESVNGDITADYPTRIIDLVQVVGKKEPKQIFELFERRGEKERVKNLITTFNDGFELYKTGHFAEAIARFEESAKLEFAYEKNPSTVYLKRCQQLTENPPEQWNGIWALNSK